MTLRILILAPLFYLSALFGDPLKAQPIRFSEDNERIMEVLLQEGLLMHENLLVYQMSEGWYFPLREFVSTLGYFIEVSPTLSLAEGYVIKDTRKFKIDGRACKAYLQEGVSAFHCNLWIPYGNEIFVEKVLLEKWFPLKISVDSFRSRIVIDPREYLPIQHKEQRERKYQREKGLGLEGDPGYSRELVGNSVLDGFFFDQQLSFLGQYGDRVTYGSLQHATSVGAEIAHLEAQGYVGGSEREITDKRLNLSKRSLEGGLLGPLDAREVQLLSVPFPSLPLIGRLQWGGGFTMSNTPLHRPERFDTQSFDGVLLQGWDVELYCNGILLDRKMGDSTGRYNFRDVPLLYGMNRFRLVFYGPQGQIEEQWREFQINQEMLRTGEQYYELGAGWVDQKPRMVIKYDQNLFPEITSTVGLARLNIEETDYADTYALMGLSTFQKNFLLTGYLGLSSRGGKAFEAGLGFPFKSATMNLKYDRLFDFRSEVFNTDTEPFLKEKVNASLSHFIPLGRTLAMKWDLDREFRLDGNAAHEFRHSVATQTGPLFWNHQLGYVFEQNTRLDGQLDLHLLQSFPQMRFGVGYNEHHFEDVEAEVVFNLGSYHLLMAEITQNLTERTTGYGLSFSRRFEPLMLSANFSGLSSGQYSIGMVLSYNLIYDSNSRRLHVRSLPHSSLGAVSVLVFEDKNYDGIQNTDEPGIPDIAITVSQQREEPRTDSHGRVLISGLKPYYPVDLSVSVMSMNDPSLQSIKKGVRIFPHTGKTLEVLFPVIRAGEIEGMINVTGFSQAFLYRRGIDMELIDNKGRVISTARTDIDGVFLFDKVRAGKYRIRVSPSQLLSLKFSSNPGDKEVIVPPGGDFVGGIDFSLKRL